LKINFLIRKTVTLSFVLIPLLQLRLSCDCYCHIATVINVVVTFTSPSWSALFPVSVTLHRRILCDVWHTVLSALRFRLTSFSKFSFAINHLPSFLHSRLTGCCCCRRQSCYRRILSSDHHTSPLQFIFWCKISINFFS